MLNINLKNNRKLNDTVGPLLSDNNKEMRYLQCGKYDESFSRDFVIINENKTDFCYRLYDKILEFDNQRFRNYLSTLRNNLGLIVRYKGSFYCSVCDPHQQKYISLQTNHFVFSNKFCKILLHKHAGLINYLHILLIEYADFLLQYV